MRQGGPRRTSFYLRKDARGLQRELHVNPGVTPTPHCTTWPTSATASLGQQRDTGTLSFILAHPPGGAPGNSVPPPPFRILANLPPSRPESPPNVGGRARHQSPGKGLVSCSCASKPFQTISQPFTAPAPRRAKVSTGRLYLLSLLTETPEAPPVTGHWRWEGQARCILAGSARLKPWSSSNHVKIFLENIIHIISGLDSRQTGLFINDKIKAHILLKMSYGLPGQWKWMDTIFL